MDCIYCSAPTSVVNSRPQKYDNNIWRRRRCVSCDGIFTTTERAELGGAMVVRYGNGKLHALSRDVLFLTIYDSCKHRTNATADSSALTQTILSQAIKLASGGIIERDQLVNIATQALKRFDKAAATIYAAYHPVPVTVKA